MYSQKNVPCTMYRRLIPCVWIFTSKWALYCSLAACATAHLKIRNTCLQKSILDTISDAWCSGACLSNAFLAQVHKLILYWYPDLSDTGLVLLDAARVTSTRCPPTQKGTTYGRYDFHDTENTGRIEKFNHEDTLKRRILRNLPKGGCNRGFCRST